MNSIILLVFVLGAPGLLFNLGRRLAGRISQRQSRDFLSAFGELILLSLPLTLLDTIIAHYIFRDIDWQLFVTTHPISELSSDKKLSLINALLKLVISGFIISLSLGIGYGSFRAWFAWFGFGPRLPLESLLTGFLRPGAFATVVTSTKLEKGVLVYRGLVENLQMSPEGNVDFVALADAEKAYLREPKRGTPRSTSFRSVVENQVFQEKSKSLLIVESEDIANILLTSIPSPAALKWFQIPPYALFKFLSSAVQRLFRLLKGIVSKIQPTN